MAVSPGARAWRRRTGAPTAAGLHSPVFGRPGGVLLGPDQLQARLWLHGFVDSAGHSASWRVRFSLLLVDFWGISNFFVIHKTLQIFAYNFSINFQKQNCWIKMCVSNFKSYHPLFDIVLITIPQTVYEILCFYMCMQTF